VLKAGLGSVADEAARSAKAKEIQDHVKRAIAPYKYPRRVEFIEALPRTSTGKVQRFRLRTPEPATPNTPAHPA
jgi:2-aminobenzoate-CoA ligase